MVSATFSLPKDPDQLKSEVVRLRDIIKEKERRIEPFMQQKDALQEQIGDLQNELQTLKAQRKATARHITVEKLPEEQRFRQLSTQSKHLIDTIKMIAYRAENAMANVSWEIISHPDEARGLLQALQ